MRDHSHALTTNKYHAKTLFAEHSTKAVRHHGSFESYLNQILHIACHYSQTYRKFKIYKPSRVPRFRWMIQPGTQCLPPSESPRPPQRTGYSTDALKPPTNLEFFKPARVLWPNHVRAPGSVFRYTDLASIFFRTAATHSRTSGQSNTGSRLLFVRKNS